MNSFIVLFLVLIVLVGLFFSFYSLFKLVFFNVGQGIQSNFGDVLLSSPPGTVSSNVVSIFVSSILAAVLSFIIIVSWAIFVIKKGNLTRIIGRN